MNKYLVYKATSPSGKVYVGLTKKTLKVRRQEHESLSRRNKIRPFHMALKKYEFDFQWEVLVENVSLEEAVQSEKEYIKLYNSTNRKFGYNLSPGGLAGSIMSEEGKRVHKEKMQKHYNNPKYIRKISETRKRLVQENPNLLKNASDALKKYYKDEDNYQKQIEHLNEIRTNPICVAKRARSMGGKPFICVETGERFEYLAQAAERFGVDKRNIHGVLKHPERYKTILRKYTFKYVRGE